MEARVETRVEARIEAARIEASVRIAARPRGGADAGVMPLAVPEQDMTSAKSPGGRQPQCRFKVCQRAAQSSVQRPGDGYAFRVKVSLSVATAVSSTHALSRIALAVALALTLGPQSQRAGSGFAQTPRSADACRQRSCMAKKAICSTVLISTT